MKVEIWSDIMCPFCYIGKRNFEKAVSQYRGKEKIEVEWKSFQLSPNMTTAPEKSIHEFLAEHKGISVEKARELNTQVAEMASRSGLTYNFDKAVVANSFNAHRFAHFAKAHGKQNEAEEKLFAAYFTEGVNIDDIDSLVEIGKTIGLDTDALRHALTHENYAEDVKADILEANEIGVNGVPFFVFDRKVAVSGAQPPSVFTQILEENS